MRGNFSVRVSSVLLLTVGFVAACGKSDPTTPSTTTPERAALSGDTTKGNSSSSSTQTQVEGVITALPPTTPAGAFAIGSQIVQTNATTAFDNSGAAKAFTDLALGQHVEVTGTAGTPFVATRIEVQPANNDANHNDNDPAESAVTGAITSRTGTAPLLTLLVNGRTVHTDGNTRVDSEDNDQGGGDDRGTEDHGHALDLSALVVGVTVNVRGTTQSDGSILASRIDVTSPVVNNNNGGEVKGVIAALTGTCPALHFTIGSTVITTDATTTFDDLSCSSLNNGTAVEVKGTTQADRSVKASKVEKNDGL